MTHGQHGGLFMARHVARNRHLLYVPALPQPPMGRTNWYHPIEAYIDPAHALPPTWKCQHVVFTTIENA